MAVIASGRLPWTMLSIGGRPPCPARVRAAVRKAGLSCRHGRSDHVQRTNAALPTAYGPSCIAASDRGSISTQTSRWFEAASTAVASGSSGAGQNTPLSVTRSEMAGRT